MNGLTAKELEISSLVAEGMRNREIAEEMLTTEDVIKNYLRTIFDKVGCWNRTELALWFVRRLYDAGQLA